MSNILVITTSLRKNSNSDILAKRLAAGAQDAGHNVEINEIYEITVIH